MAERLRLVKWRKLQSGKLLGFATVQLPIGLEIRDCPVLNGNEGPWAALPGKPELDREGRCKTGAAGERIYAEILAWRSRKLREAFSVRVVELVRAAHPADLE
jgi:hypothetical protein